VLGEQVEDFSAPHRSPRQRDVLWAIRLSPLSNRRAAGGYRAVHPKQRRARTEDPGSRVSTPLTLTYAVTALRSTSAAGPDTRVSGRYVRVKNAAPRLLLMDR
jgi:hypothetical protein